MQYPPNQPTYPYPPQPPRKRTLREWYRTRSRNQQAGIGCLILLGVLFVGSLCIAAIGAVGSSSANSDTPTPTATSGNVAVASSTSPTAAIPTEQPTARATAKPTPRPTPKPAAPTPTPKPKCQAVNNNPWCYNFSPGNLIYNPPANFCDYFNCIPSFWTSTNGYVDECVDGMYSHSGGRSGACSHHGGELQPLYSH